MEWNRKEFKRQAKLSLRNNYLVFVIACVIIMLTAGEFSGTKENLIDGASTNLESSVFNRLPVTDSAVVEEFVNGLRHVDNVREQARHQLKKYRPNRGVLAPFFNSIGSSGEITTGILNAVNTLAFQGQIGASAVIFAANLLRLAWFLFIGQILVIGTRRIFLEGRRYYATRMDRVMFIFHIKRVIRSSLVILRMMIYQLLWMLTIIGGIIKHYSYYLVPYILAENPNIDGKTAIRLSRAMMSGYKGKVFVLDLTYIGWNILNALTFGLLGIFFINPYRTAVDAEIYMHLRSRAKTRRLPDHELLNDNYLDTEIPEEAIYPTEEFSIPLAPARKWLKIDYDKKYSVVHLVLIFFIFAFIGWCWEVVLLLLQEGVFANRGVLRGPWLPIYGAGGILVVVLLRPFRKNHLLTFFLSMLLCGIVEYVTSLFLELSFGEKWWDYSGYLLNLDGRVCLEGLLFFGLGCYLMIYILTPLIDSLLDKLPNKPAWLLAGLLLILFASDLVYSHFHPNIGYGITEDKKTLTRTEFYLPRSNSASCALKKS